VQSASAPVQAAGSCRCAPPSVLARSCAPSGTPASRHPSAHNGCKLLLSVLVLAATFLIAARPVFAAGIEPLGAVPVPATNPQTAEKIDLGRTLFFDRRLSGDGTMSCASCHIPEQGFADGQAIALNYPTTRNWRNSQTLINVAYQKSLFHDGRSGSLEEQALFPLMSAFEMNQNLDFVEEELRSVPEYLAAFTRVFGSPDITREQVAMAIAAFERTIVSRDAPLDRYLAATKRRSRARRRPAWRSSPARDAAAPVTPAGTSRATASMRCTSPRARSSSAIRAWPRQGDSWPRSPATRIFATWPKTRAAFS